MKHDETKAIAWSGRSACSIALKGESMNAPKMPCVEEKCNRIAGGSADEVQPNWGTGLRKHNEKQETDRFGL